VLRAFSFLLRWTGLLCVPGGLLWALSPVGVHLSELWYHTPNVFWKLFPSAPLLLLAGLIGLHAVISGRSGWLERAGFILALLGLVLILAGDVGQFWLGLDDVYIMTAPAYRAFRLGLVVLAVGSLIFGVAAGRDRALPVWGALPFAIGALCGLVSFSRELGQLGAVLWILFGLGWAWLGLVLLTEGVSRHWRQKRDTPSRQDPTPEPNLYNPTPWSGNRDRRGVGVSAPSDGPPAGEPDRLPEAAGDVPSGAPGVAATDAIGGSGGDTYVARVARGAGISTVGQGAGRVLGYLTQVMIARLFGPAAFGYYSLGVAAVNGAQILARFGMENGVVRYVAHHRAREDTSRVRGTIIQAIGVTLVLSLLLSAVMFFGAGFAAEWYYNKPFMETVLRAFALTLPFFTFMMMVLWATQGFQTVTYASYVQQMIRPALFLVLVPVFYLLGAGVIGTVAAYGVSMFLGSLVAVYYLRKLFPPLFDNKVAARFETKELFAVSVPMSVTTGAQYLNTWSAVWVMGAFAAAGPVGIFTAAARTATLSTIVRFAFSGIFSPIISSFYARGELADLGRLYKDVSRWIFTGALAIFLPIVLLSREILAIFGPDFTAGWTALIIVAAAQLYSSSVGPTPRMLAMTGNQNLAMVATAAAALVGVGVSFALVPGLGMLGAALGMASAIVTENTATMLGVRWRLGIWPYNWAWLKPIVAGLLAASGAFLAGFVLPLPGVLATIAVVGAAFGAGYLALLLLFGLNDTDREFLGAFRDVALRYLRRGRRSEREDRG
jgi:O-antigen/teichoic acid export membrane protein